MYRFASTSLPRSASAEIRSMSITERDGRRHGSAAQFLAGVIGGRLKRQRPTNLQIRDAIRHVRSTQRIE
jgi:hypothetical protein